MFSLIFINLSIVGAFALLWFVDSLTSVPLNRPSNLGLSLTHW